MLVFVNKHLIDLGQLPLISLSRQRDLENFLEQTRSKFVGFYVKNDRQSLAGLPLPIHESVSVLKQVGEFDFVAIVGIAWMTVVSLS